MAGHLCWIHLFLSVQASVWLSWCFDPKTPPVSGVWRPSTPCVRWSNPGFALIYSAIHPLPFASFVMSLVIVVCHSLSSHSRYCLHSHLIAEIKNTTLRTLLHLKFIHFLCICFKIGHVFKKNFPLSDTDSLPGSVPGLVPAACEGGDGGSVQRRLLSELVSRELLGCAH